MLNLLICSINAEFVVDWLEQLIHHRLKCGWWICKSEVHNIGFEEAEFRFEHHLVLIPFLDVNIVISPSDIKFSKDPGIFCLSDQIGDKG